MALGVKPKRIDLTLKRPRKPKSLKEEADSLTCDWSELQTEVMAGLSMKMKEGVEFGTGLGEMGGLPAAPGMPDIIDHRVSQ